MPRRPRRAPALRTIGVVALACLLLAPVLSADPRGAPPALRSGPTLSVREGPTGARAAAGPAPSNLTSCPSSSFDATIFVEESGLEYGTHWSINVTGFSNGTNNSSANGTMNELELNVPAGCYLYYIPPVTGYLEAYAGNFSALSSVLIVVNFTSYPQWAPPAVLAGVVLWGLLVTFLAVYWVRRR
jgi:hypothetical protein